MLALGCVASAGAQTVETFAVVGDYGSGGGGPNDVVKKAAKGVADQLATQNPSFVLSLGDQLYGPFPIPAGTSHSFETVPLAATDAAGGYGNAVGKLYSQFILPNPSLTASLGNNAGTATTMNFFPVLGDHDWRHETVQADPATGTLITNATSGCCVGFTPNFAYGTLPTTDVNAQFYANAAQTFSATPYFITADTIAIPCTNTPAAGWLLRNGFTGDAAHGLSNICDNNPLIYDSAGLNKTMWNHAPIFEKAVI